MRSPASSLGIKLNLSLLAFFIALGVAMAMLILFGFRRSQHEATTESQQGLEAQGRTTMLGFAGANAYVGQYIVNQATTKGHDAATYLEATLATPAAAPPTLTQSQQGGLYNPAPDRVSDVWVPATREADPAALADVRESAALDLLFPALFERYGEGFSGDDTVRISYMSARGVIRSYPPVPDGGAATAGDLTPAQEATLRSVGATGNPQRGVVWSAPHQDATSGLIVTAYTPVYAGDDFRGVIAVDLSMTSLLARADGIQITEHAYAFVIDRDGNILPGKSHDIISAELADTDNTNFQHVIEHMRAGEQNADRAIVNGQEVFVAYSPLGDFGGSLALVAPVSDVTSEAGAVTAALDSAGNRTLFFTLMTMLVFFALALLAAAWLNRAVLLRPIAALVDGTRAVAGGNLDVQILTRSRDELGDLAISFNMMTDEIRQRRDALRSEIAERERTQNELDALFSAITDIVLVLDKDGVYLRQAPTRAARHPVAQKRREMILGRTVTDILGPDQGAAALDAIRSALSSGRTSSFEYSLSIEDELRWYAASISPLTEDTVVWVARDITERVEAQRLLEQRVEERTRELSTLLDVARDIGSTLELRPLLTVILRQLRAVAEFDEGGFLLLDGDAIETVAVLGADAKGTAALERQLGTRIPMGGRMRLWDAIGEGRPLIIPDVSADTPEARAWQRTVGATRETTFAGVRAWMGVPVTSRDRVIGMVAMTTRGGAGFSERSAQLATAIAGQAGIAVEHARLYEQAEARSRELSTLLEVAHSVSSTLEVQPLLSMLLDQIQGVVGFDRAAFMLLENRELKIVNVMGPRSGPDEELETHVGMRFPTGERARLWEPIQDGRPLIIDDVRADSPDARAYREAVGDAIDTRFAGVRSWMAVPVASHERVIGMVVTSRTEPGWYTDRHAQIATAIASQAAIAIENARLFEETQRRARDMEALLQVARNVATQIELEPLLEVVLEQMRVVADYHRASIMVVEDSMLVVRAVRDFGSPTGYRAQGRVGLRYPVREEPLFGSPGGKDPLIIDDILAETSVAAAYRGGEDEAIDIAKVPHGSYMSIPLVAQDRVVGVISMARDEVGYFTQEHAGLARAIASQVAVAIENARLFEQAEERTRELGALLDVSRGITSKLDQRQLVGEILRQIRTIIDYNGASVMLRQGDELVILESDRPERDDGGPEQGWRFPLTAMGDWWAAMERGEHRIIPDVRADTVEAQRYQEAVGGLLETGLRHVRSWLGVPLVLREDVIGVLTMTHATPGFFTQAHAQIVRAIADQAALALRNAQLFAEARERARETEALIRADERLFGSLDLDEVFQALTDVAVDVLAVDKCLVTAGGADGSAYVVRAHRNFSAESTRLMNTLLADPMPLAQDPRDDGTMPPLVIEDLRTADPRLQPILESEGLRSAMVVPIRSDIGLYGRFAVAYTEPHRFSADEQRLMLALADRAAVAIENAELYRRSQHAATLEERQRLARELHDSVSQALYGIALGARTARTQLERDPSLAVEPTEYVMSLAEAGLAEMRSLIFELRPESLETEGLVAAIEKHVAATRARYRLDVHAELCDEPDAALNVKEALYRIAQEALHNTVKHAQASHVDVMLLCRNGEIELVVRDNGRGFDPDGSFPGHLGLQSMQERAARARADIRIASAPGRGTTISVRAPSH